MTETDQTLALEQARQRYQQTLKQLDLAAHEHAQSTMLLKTAEAAIADSYAPEA